MSTPRVSLAIVSYNTRDLLLKCLESVFGSVDAGDVEVIVVDNGSTDDSSEAVLARYPRTDVVQTGKNRGFAAAANVALARARGAYVVLLNSDTEIRRDSLSVMARFLDEHPEAGVVGPRLVYEDGTTQPSADFAPNLMTEFLHLFRVKRLLPGENVRQAVAPVLRKASGKTVGTYFEAYSADLTPREVDCVSGACLMIRRGTLDAAGLLDERFFMYMEDMDWCLRAKSAGAKVFYLPEVEVVHHVGSSGEASDHVFVERYASRLYFFTKHRGRPARFIVRVMTVLAFALRWPFSRRRRVYGQIIKLALGGQGK